MKSNCYNPRGDHQLVFVISENKIWTSNLVEFCLSFFGQTKARCFPSKFILVRQREDNGVDISKKIAKKKRAGVFIRTEILDLTSIIR